MADLIAHIKSHPPVGEFSACAHYGPEEDALMFHFRNEPEAARG